MSENQQYEKAITEIRENEYDFIAVGAMYNSTIYGIENNEIIVKINDIIPCKVEIPKYGRMPAVGDKYVIEVEEKHKDLQSGTYQIFGRLIPKKGRYLLHRGEDMSKQFFGCKQKGCH